MGCCLHTSKEKTLSGDVVTPWCTVCYGTWWYVIYKPYWHKEMAILVVLGEVWDLVWNGE